MSASICWEPTPKKTRAFFVLATSSFQRMLEQASMGLPRVFDERDLAVLGGMAAVFGERPDTKNPFLEMIAAIEKHQEIRVWVEY